MTERWRPVVGYEHGYQVSDLGRVRSIPRVTSRSTLPGGPISPARTGTRRSYLFVHLYGDGTSEQKYVHRLVLEAFVGPCPPGLETRHLNGDSFDNRLSNLRWGTRAENAADRIRHGTATNQNTSKTHCPQGHPYEGNNLHIRPDGRRRCRACAREYAQRKRDEAA